MTQLQAVASGPFQHRGMTKKVSARPFLRFCCTCSTMDRPMSHLLPAVRQTTPTIYIFRHPLANNQPSVPHHQACETSPAQTDLRCNLMNCHQQLKNRCPVLCSGAASRRVCYAMLPTLHAQTAARNIFWPFSPPLHSQWSMDCKTSDYPQPLCRRCMQASRASVSCNATLFSTTTQNCRLQEMPHDIAA